MRTHAAIIRKQTRLTSRCNSHTCIKTRVKEPKLSTRSPSRWASNTSQRLNGSQSCSTIAIAALKKQLSLSCHLRVEMAAAPACHILWRVMKIWANNKSVIFWTINRSRGTSQYSGENQGVQSTIRSDWSLHLLRSSASTKSRRPLWRVRTMEASLLPPRRI